MNIHIDIQNASKEPLPITKDDIHHWITSALSLYPKPVELTLRFVDEEEITQLNTLYRKKPSPTNVLAFSATYPSNIKLKYTLLGDVIICPTILNQESKALKKPLIAHYAHIIIHGILHLLGYDHIKTKEANEMQSIEIELLSRFGFNNPYE